MLILSRDDDVLEVWQAIVHAGYGFSVMSEPEREESYSRASTIEMLRDWGWAGSPETQPHWLGQVRCDASH